MDERERVRAGNGRGTAAHAVRSEAQEPLDVDGLPRPRGRTRREWVLGAASALAFWGLQACRGPASRGERTQTARPLGPPTASATEPSASPPRPDEPAEVPAQEPATEPALEERGLFPAPDLTDERFLRNVAGLRPYRRAGVRVELERVRETPVVHHYGHGGAGITLAWGSAVEAVNRLVGVVPSGARVAVVGAGVCGLCTAQVLLERGYRVSLYSALPTERTTSMVAGGQFSPSLVSTRDPAGEGGRFERMLRASFGRFSARVGEEWGVFRRPNYTTRGAGGGLSRLPADLVPREALRALPIEGVERPGGVYHTLLVEPPRFLKRLRDEVVPRLVEERRRTFRDLRELDALDVDAVLCCVGLGARELARDSSVIPVRGQLVHLQPQDLPYLLSHSGYLFPRSDALVLGGTVERGVSDATPDAGTCARLLARHRAFFGHR